MRQTRKLPLSFYRRPVSAVARDLLGRTLCRRVGPRSVLRGTIVEVEAYAGAEDRASHARMGPTRRNRPMFEAGGVAYVYFVYGMHHCLNVVTGEQGEPAAVLLRAVALEGRAPSEASGPGRLARTFSIDRELDGATFAGSVLWIEAGSPVADREVERTARIGVAYAGTWAVVPWRWAVRDHPAVSGRRLTGRPKPG